MANDSVVVASPILEVRLSPREDPVAAAAASAAATCPPAAVETTPGGRQRRVLFPKLYSSMSSLTEEASVSSESCSEEGLHSTASPVETAATPMRTRSSLLPARPIDEQGYANLHHILPLSPLQDKRGQRNKNLVRGTKHQVMLTSSIAPVNHGAAVGCEARAASVFGGVSSFPHVPRTAHVKNNNNANSFLPVLPLLPLTRQQAITTKAPAKSSENVPSSNRPSPRTTTTPAPAVPAPTRPRRTSSAESNGQYRVILPQVSSCPTIDGGNSRVEDANPCRRGRAASTGGSCTSVQRPSILRSKVYQPKNAKKISFCCKTGTAAAAADDSHISKISSTESDLPSLAPSDIASTDEPGTPDQERSLPLAVSANSIVSDDASNNSASSSVSFDARVWVREFERTKEEKQTTWYTAEDLDVFKGEALQRIIMSSPTELIPTGTGRMISRPVLNCKAIFSHQAMRWQPDKDESESTTEQQEPQETPSTSTPNQQTTETDRPDSSLRVVVEKEIRNILLVDPHDICVQLFTKALKTLIPHVAVTAAASGDEALQHMEQSNQHYDVVIVEERLHVFHRQLCRDHRVSGSVLTQRLAENAAKTLFIGVSAHLNEDEAAMRASGADLCWSKPPPPMNQHLLHGILKDVLVKRGQETLANDLFASL